MSNSRSDFVQGATNGVSEVPKLIGNASSASYMDWVFQGCLSLECKSTEWTKLLIPDDQSLENGKVWHVLTTTPFGIHSATLLCVFYVKSERSTSGTKTSLVTSTIAMKLNLLQSLACIFVPQQCSTKTTKSSNPWTFFLSRNKDIYCCHARFPA